MATRLATPGSMSTQHRQTSPLIPGCHTPHRLMHQEPHPHDPGLEGLCFPSDQTRSSEMHSQHRWVTAQRCREVVLSKIRHALAVCVHKSTGVTQNLVCLRSLSFHLNRHMSRSATLGFAEVKTSDASAMTQQPLT